MVGAASLPTAQSTSAVSTASVDTDSGGSSGSSLPHPAASTLDPGGEERGDDEPGPADTGDAVTWPLGRSIPYATVPDATLPPNLPPGHDNPPGDRPVDRAVIEL